MIIVPGSDSRLSVHNAFVLTSHTNMMQLLQKGIESTACKKKDFQGTQRTKHVCLWDVLTVCLNP